MLTILRESSNNMRYAKFYNKTIKIVSALKVLLKRGIPYELRASYNSCIGRTVLMIIFIEEVTFFTEYLEIFR